LAEIPEGALALGISCDHEERYLSTYRTAALRRKVDRRP